MPKTHFRLLCLACGHPEVPPAIECGACHGALGHEYDMQGVAWDERYRGSIWRYWRLLPVTDPARTVTLGEANTPLLRSRLHPGLQLHWKDESRNPTGSHKDRALAVAMSVAVAAGARRSIVVSAGSTGLSNAAYAAAAGLASVTVMTRGAPEARIWPLVAYGSRIIEVEAGIDTLIAAARGFAGRDGTAVASTTRWCNPAQAEAAKTIAYEVVEQLGDAPEWMVMPVGGGGTLAAIWRGFVEMRALGLARRLPRLAAVVPRDYAAIALAMQLAIVSEQDFAALPGDDDVPTLLTRLAHSHPPDGVEALAALRASNGIALAVDDAAAVDGALRAAGADGLYLEPSSGITVPALDQLVADGVIAPGAVVVALGCGSGFRETTTFQSIRPSYREGTSLEALGAAIFGTACTAPLDH